MAKPNRGGRRAEAPMPKSRFSHISKPKEKEPEKVKWVSGKNAQADFIEYVKRLTNVDLSKAREYEYDKRRGFNIDERLLTRNELTNLNYFLSKNQAKNSFQVNVLKNGRYRWFIDVKEKKVIK